MPVTATSSAPVAVSVVSTYDHLHQVIAMLGSLRSTWRRPVEVHLGLVDGWKAPRPGLGDDVHVVTLPDLGLPNVEWLATKFTAFQLSSIAKPFLVRATLDRGARTVVYLDADMLWFDEPTGLLDGHDGAPLVALAHVDAAPPPPVHARPAVADIALAGALNAGIFRVTAGPAVDRFLTAWAAAVSRPGLFADEVCLASEQQAFNLAAAATPGFEVHHDPTVNVAYWNLHERPVRWAALDGGDPERFELDGRSVACVHFSGFAFRDGAGPMSRHGGDRVSRELSPTAHALCELYERRLVAAERDHYEAAAYEWSQVDGVALTPALRASLRRSEEALVPLDGPFDVVARDAIGQLYATTEPTVGVAEHLWRVVRSRSDLHRHWLEPRWFDADLLSWLTSSLPFEHPEGIAYDRFGCFAFDRNNLEVLAGRIEDASRGAIPAADAAAGLRRDRLGLLARFDAVAGHPDHAEVRLDIVVGGWRIAADEAVACLRTIWTRRVDLRAAFPDPVGRDLPGFTAWLATAPQTEYDLPPAVAELAASFPVDRALARVLARIQRDDVMLTMARAGGIDDALVAAIRFDTGEHNGVHTADVALFDWWLHDRPAAEVQALLERAVPPALPTGSAGAGSAAGMNLFGHHRSPNGLGTLAAGVRTAASAAGVPVTPVTLAANSLASDLTVADLEPHPDPDRAADVVVTFPHVDHDPIGYLPPGWTDARARAALVTWEQRDVHPAWPGRFARYDALWGISRFTAEAIANGFGRPCDVLPCVVTVDPDPAVGRSELDLPAGAFVVTLVLDAASAILRKNPVGTVRAVAKAFAGDPDVHVVLKVGGGAHRRFQPEVRRVLAELEAVGLDHRLVTEVLPRRHLHALVAASDLVASLHRCEGFGYTMAEAMALGVPVVATGYSGNLDFMTADNSLLVESREVVVREGEGPFTAGSLWAEPDLDDAADKCRWVRDHRDEALAMAERGRQTVLAQHSPDAVGRELVRLLDALT